MSQTTEKNTFCFCNYGCATINNPIGTRDKDVVTCPLKVIQYINTNGIFPFNVGGKGGSNSKIFFESLPKISNDRLLHYCSVGVVGIDRSSGLERESSEKTTSISVQLGIILQD